MADLMVITPSRGRPGQLSGLAEAVRRTTSGRVAVLGLVDDDDPQREAYERLVGVEHTVHANVSNLRIVVGPRRSLSGWTNLAARNVLLAPDPPRYLASLGDDHQPRTADWDLMLIGAIENLGAPGFAYGNDLLAGQSLPTAWVVSAEIVRALGWMMLPTCGHMFVDAAVLALGQAMGRIVYLPDVVIEHLHPNAGKALRDESYIESNSPEQRAADWKAFNAWHTEQLPTDAALIAAAPLLPAR